MNAEAAPVHDTDWYVDHLVADVERFASVLAAGPQDAAVAACPGWTVRGLAAHLGQVHRWATFAVTHGRPPTAEDGPLPLLAEDDDAGRWLRDGADALAAALRSIDPDAPTWHPFPVDRVARVWPRRQAHETAIHRWDAERAIGREPTLDAVLASDGIDEYFELAVPRLVAREGLELPSGSLHVHCTDVHGEWLVWSDDGECRLVRAHEKGDAALRGPAAEILLRLWGRSSDGAAELSPVGDGRVLDDWLAIAGM